MVFHQRRQRERRRAERAAAGNPIPLLSTFDRQTRTRILYAMRDSSGGFWDQIGETLHDLILREWGALSLMGYGTVKNDLEPFIVQEANDGQTLDLVEAWFAAAEISHLPNTYVDGFRERVNRILDEDEMAYQVVGSQVVPRESMEMFAEVVAPTVSLLHGQPKLEKVEKAFHDALRELKPDGDPSDAITDAATALQEMLTTLGCTGNSLGPLIADAKKRELLGPYDSKLSQGIEQIADWVSAHRSTRGDSHTATDATRDEAWLAVHIAGALILYLEGQKP